MKRVRFMAGDAHRITLPYSEAAVHAKLAGHTVLVRLKPNNICDVSPCNAYDFGGAYTRGECGINTQGTETVAHGTLDPAAPKWLR